MFYGVLDLRTHRLSFSSAGHYPFPLFDDGSSVHPLECSGRPLGLFGDAKFSRRETSLEAVRRVLLVSDGVLEVLPGPPGPQKMERLIETLRTEPDIDGLVRGFGIDPAAHHRDDVTLLLLERKANHA
jgi:serine phosphatase RsbU (regulator of sigma subunit)